MSFKEYIISKGVRQNYLAEQLGLSEASITKKLNGKREFKMSEVQKIAEILKMNKSEIDEVFFPNILN